MYEKKAVAREVCTEEIYDLIENLKNDLIAAEAGTKKYADVIFPKLHALKILSSISNLDHISELCNVTAYKCDGVIATATSSAIRITLPNVESEDHLKAVVANLQHIYDRTPYDCGWVVDISALQAMPTLLLGALLSHQNNFHHRGQRLELTGVHPNLFPPMLASKLAECFIIKHRDPFSQKNELEASVNDQKKEARRELTNLDSEIDENDSMKPENELNRNQEVRGELFDLDENIEPEDVKNHIKTFEGDDI